MQNLKISKWLNRIKGSKIVVADFWDEFNYSKSVISSVGSEHAGLQ